MLSIDLLDPTKSTNADLAALNAFERRMALEARPGDQPVPLVDTVSSLNTIAQYDVPLGLVGADVYIATWVCRDPAGAVNGRARIMTEDRAENRHVAVFDVGVLSQARRSGLGRTLFDRVATEAGARSRSLLLATTDSLVPSGEAFVRRIGGRRGVVMLTMDLSTHRVDRKLLSRWIDRSLERAGGFELGLWEGPYPDEAIVAIVPLLNEIMNAEPRGDLDVADDCWSSEQLRQIEGVLWGRKLRRWAMYVRETDSGEYAGYSETYHDARNPHTLVQGLTGVASRFRNRGLGRWLKAAMLEHVLERLPDVRVVRTSVAESNDAMLRINRELGFESLGHVTHWQVRLEDVRSYLAG